MRYPARPSAVVLEGILDLDQPERSKIISNCLAPTALRFAVTFQSLPDYPVSDALIQTFRFSSSFFSAELAFELS